MMKRHSPQRLFHKTLLNTWQVKVRVSDGFLISLWRQRVSNAIARAVVDVIKDGYL